MSEIKRVLYALIENINDQDAIDYLVHYLVRHNKINHKGLLKQNIKDGRTPQTAIKVHSKTSGFWKYFTKDLPNKKNNTTTYKAILYGQATIQIVCIGNKEQIIQTINEVWDRYRSLMIYQPAYLMGKLYYEPHIITINFLQLPDTTSRSLDSYYSPREYQKIFRIHYDEKIGKCVLSGRNYKKIKELESYDESFLELLESNIK